MRAVIRRDGKLVVDEMEAPQPGPGQILARSLVCGICGSDLHLLDHYDHMIDLTTRLGGISQMRKGADTVFGHEFCCEVLESSGAFKAGDGAASVAAELPGEHATITLALVIDPETRLLRMADVAP